ncbi:cytochrome c maturation protein CcmE [Deferribacteraceae bacterium V6Fe1]|jgi:cytochrome c-type biogenesis protein CcmE|nr:cytochrome c maturation protein CcmE [Deferribacterales bacterium]UOD35247.1 cytochrome c maturation protein CcmE [Deferribacteraceae bacterium V6Fe1]
MKKGTKLAIIGIIVIAAVFYLISTGFKQSGVYYLEVHELIKDPSKYNTKGIRVSGDVVDGTVVKDTKNQHLEFVMADGTGEKMNVIYNGIIPDAFTEEVQVIVEGKYDKDTNTFKATTLLAKCPSKYEAEVEKK